MDYAAAVRELTARGRFGVSLGLERVARLMAELDHPERRLRGALVGGTNGKGSVVAMVRSVLNAAGHRVGGMPKPHLVSYRERITVDGRSVAPDEFAAAVERVLPAIDRVAAEVGPPTEFETLTAAAITELGRMGVELAVIEVGLGGRLDATNVLTPALAIITNVELDHTAHLGPTIADIACFPWIRPWKRQGQNLDEHPNLKRWFEAIDQRPAVQRGVQVPAESMNLNRTMDDETRSILFGDRQFSRP